MNRRFWLTKEILVSRGFVIFAFLLLQNNLFTDSSFMHGILAFYVIFWAITLIREYQLNRKDFRKVDHTHPWED